MALISFEFFAFLLIAVGCYYLCPAKCRFLVLLAASGYYFYAADGYRHALCLLGFILLFFISALLLQKFADRLILRRLIYFSTLAAAVFALIFLKYYNPLGLSAPLGMSFWMLSGIGLVTDVYWGSIQEKISPVRVSLLIGFFPMMMSGPIVRYRETADKIAAPHKLCYEHLTFGAQRILWGCFKKLVISQRLAVIVNTVCADTQTFQGFYILIALSCFSLQLYTDFSGAMDIVLGAAQLFGIELPENFNTPFFSKTVSEFWRRWHMTLGAWLKDYVLYPLLHCGLFRSVKRKLKKPLGKKWGEQIPLYLGMFVSWFLIGYWHGGAWKYIFGVGIWFWALIVLGEILSPLFCRIADIFRINRNCFSWHLLQSLRTFVIVTVGLSFFRAADFYEAFCVWKAAFSKWNPQALWGSSLLSMGLDLQNTIVLAVSCLALLLVSSLRCRGIRVRECLAAQNLALRWIIYLLLLFAVIIFGLYGAEYNAADFIYQGF